MQKNTLFQARGKNVKQHKPDESQLQEAHMKLGSSTSTLGSEKW